jgi:hypothetical protein
MSEHEVYLGDGLYASFDGYQIRLRAPREGGDHVRFTWTARRSRLSSNFSTLCR